MTIEQSSSEIVQGLKDNNDLFKQNIINSLTEVIKKIRGRSKRGEILQTCVEIVHQTLECDRTVIYSLSPKSQGKIINEALTPGFTPTLDSIIEDSCFTARYIDRYQKGRVQAIPNIYEAGMSACYIENLEKIEVKANLVVPAIEPDGTLFGLLVMHQCSNFRIWQQSEINFCVQISNWMMERVYEGRKYQELQKELDFTDRYHQLLTEITQNLHDANSKAEVLQIGVDRVKVGLKCDRVVVYGLENNNLGEIIAESTLPALAPLLGKIIKDPCFEYRFVDKYQQGRVRAIDNIYEAGMTSCYIENLEKIGVKANLIVPILGKNNQLYGLLVAHQCFEFREWQAWQIDWLKQIGYHIGLSLSRANLEVELNSIESSLLNMETAKDAITLAKAKIQEIQKPIENTTGVLVEINNLTKLLNREMLSVDRSSVIRTQKETKLFHIIVKKLSLNIEKLKSYLGLLQTDTSHMEDLLEDAAIHLYPQKSFKKRELERAKKSDNN
jgi:methyl-accepting chemotaxis protein PixJ